MRFVLGLVILVAVIGAIAFGAIGVMDVSVPQEEVTITVPSGETAP